jgi:hypothetical protein
MKEEIKVAKWGTPKKFRVTLSSKNYSKSNTVKLVYNELLGKQIIIAYWFGSAWFRLLLSWLLRTLLITNKFVCYNQELTPVWSKIKLDFMNWLHSGSRLIGSLWNRDKLIPITH